MRFVEQRYNFGPIYVERLWVRDGEPSLIAEADAEAAVLDGRKRLRRAS